MAGTNPALAVDAMVSGGPTAGAGMQPRKVALLGYAGGGRLGYVTASLYARSQTTACQRPGEVAHQWRSPQWGGAYARTALDGEARCQRLSIAGVSCSRSS